ncbi:M13 family metallopeptidase [Alteriqipengyuania flavescens]|uniref:M13 family metallopeptidase n=1 Tax=Alteriqipengyuania flavescens TaxID=3053610 RepID=UPI0025B60D97|nr:M13 family metallopeptidase [Alteriqipengyuania flavescens]WJY19399.1 M13 family metallopeptidase [Alteriqipengyuania flavescens]WJY25341.1 M13 family metallopeptidase [Alteriqipengyuania flavescens]
MLRTMLAAGASLAALAMAAPALAQDGESTTPEMDFGSWGVQPELLDQSVDPGDDFFDYVNGKWIDANPIPSEYSRFGAFTLLGEKSRDDVKALVDELEDGDFAAGSTEARIATAYKSYLDTDAIDAAGMAPAYPYLGEIYGASNLTELAAVMAKPGMPSLISGGVTVDSKDPDTYIVGVGFDGMGLPDRDYYLVDNERNTAIRAAYMDYLTFLLDKAGYADAATTAQAVYAFEKQVAMVEWDRTMLRNADLTYNKLTRAELDAATEGFPLATMLNAMDLGDVDAFDVSQMPPTAEEIETLGLTAEDLAKIGGGLPAMAKLIASTDLPVLQAYLAKSFLNSNSSVLPSDIDAANFAFYGKTLSGAQDQQPRWKRAIAATQGMLGEQLGKVYVERYFPAASKEAMDELVANLRLAMADSIEENDWMTAETKAQALAKLNSFNPKIGYPDSFETYDGLTITSDPLANRMAAAEWGMKDNLSKLGTEVDKTEWFMLPQTVNAYYNPVFNEIVFPAAILQQPFFGASADPAVNYGAIGGVIGHEIGHGFDDQGAKYDATGTLRDWWQPEDKARFTELGDALAAQYDAYCPYDDGETCVNGRFTLGENIGDVGGLSLAYRAYQLSLNGEEAPVIDGLTGDQRFFLAWAQVWRAMQREEIGRQRLQVDPHSPEEYRVNGVVRNIDAWYDAFGVTPDDELYLPPEERVKIW